MVVVRRAEEKIAGARLPSEEDAENRRQDWDANVLLFRVATPQTTKSNRSLLRGNQRLKRSREMPRPYRIDDCHVN